MFRLRRHLGAVVVAGAIATGMVIAPAQAEAEHLTRACERLGSTITLLEGIIADRPQLGFLQDLLQKAKDAYAEFCAAG
jgi:hypothetical protein